MSTVTRSVIHRTDHFEPEANLHPAEKRRMRAHLEQIDFAAFAANQALLGRVLGTVSLARFERLAKAAAIARGQWIAAGLELGESSRTPEDITRIAALRQSYDELAAVYEGLRRAVERGYCHFQGAP